VYVHIVCAGAMLADRPGAGAAGDAADFDPELQPLLEALERTRRCNRPLLLVNDPRITWEPTCGEGPGLWWLGVYGVVCVGGGAGLC
jgi:hypothetical protein